MSLFQWINTFFHTLIEHSNCITKNAAAENIWNEMIFIVVVIVNSETHIKENTHKHPKYFAFYLNSRQNVRRLQLNVTLSNTMSSRLLSKWMNKNSTLNSKKLMKTFVRSKYTCFWYFGLLIFFFSSFHFDMRATTFFHIYLSECQYLTEWKRIRCFRIIYPSRKVRWRSDRLVISANCDESIQFRGSFDCATGEMHVVWIEDTAPLFNTQLMYAEKRWRENRKQQRTGLTSPNISCKQS